MKFYRYMYIMYLRFVYDLHYIFQCLIERSTLIKQDFFSRYPLSGVYEYFQFMTTIKTFSIKTYI